jgi:hypothetical protein
MSRFPVENGVLGLINGYGTIALHGEEGFRAELASLACIFTDGVELLPRPARRPLTRALLMPLQQTLRSRGQRGIGKYYGVPCVSVESALSIGLLEEFGVRPQAIAELRAMQRDSRTPPPGSAPPRPPAPPAVPTRAPLRLRVA